MVPTLFRRSIRTYRYLAAIRYKLRATIGISLWRVWFHGLQSLVGKPSILLHHHNIFNLCWCPAEIKPLFAKDSGYFSNLMPHLWSNPSGLQCTTCLHCRRGSFDAVMVFARSFSCYSTSCLKGLAEPGKAVQLSEMCKVNGRTLYPWQGTWDSRPQVQGCCSRHTSRDQENYHTDSALFPQWINFISKSLKPSSMHWQPLLICCCSLLSYPPSRMMPEFKQPQLP